MSRLCDVNSILYKSFYIQYVWILKINDAECDDGSLGFLILLILQIVRLKDLSSEVPLGQRWRTVPLTTFLLSIIGYLF